MDDMMKATLDDIALDLRIATREKNWKLVIVCIDRLYAITGRYGEPAPCCDPRLSNVTP